MLLVFGFISQAPCGKKSEPDGRGGGKPLEGTSKRYGAASQDRRWLTVPFEAYADGRSDVKTIRALAANLVDPF